MTASNETDFPIACDLSALDPEERTRRADLAQRVQDRVREVKETPTGFELRLDPDIAAHREAFDWLLLERRCCPFLQLQLTLEPGPGAVWIKLAGGQGVKEFLAAAILKPTGSTTPDAF
jgi:hypothetical protein